MLHYRQRGKTWHVRGSVRVGQRTVKIPERSTGFAKLKDAREYGSKLESDIRQSALYPDQDKSDRTTFDDCLRLYLNKKRLKPSEIQKIKILVPHFEGVLIADIGEAWKRFLSRKQNLAPSTINRYADVIRGIINCCAEDMNIKAPKIQRYSVKNQVVFFLPEQVRAHLLACYSEHARPIFNIFAYQGLREQENLQLKWEDVDLQRSLLFIRISKNGEPRQVPMHKKVWWTLARHWIESGRPITGNVWLNKWGQPYTDTRQTGCGGSPIRKAHTLALARLKKQYGIEIKMRVHDWRHDWASRMVMAGVDLLTVQKLGGWKSLDMVKRYATLSSKHEIDAINKI